ncbi:uncharacterized protein LOC110739051 [Chenopodium quinoa]|uniref:uncharacterized protein LOC110739051 n=1 Tax=Chenopodium quinoa TaxID=63459 RepID=UPI000B78FD88|nr:uncharacterized protein LOC110739051 [Chenopodium quinoa]
MEKKKLKDENTTSTPSEGRNLDGLVPFPGRLAEKKLNDKFAKFLSVIKNFHINLPFIEIVTQMPSYSKFLKDILTNKRKLITLLHQKDVDTPLIFGREALKSLGVVINCKNNTITCEVADEKIVFEFSKLLKTPMVEKCYMVDVLNEELDRLGSVMMKPQDPMVEALTYKEEYQSQEAKEFVMAMEETQMEEDHEQQEDKEELELKEEKMEESSKPPPKVELKPLPPTLKYACLGNEGEYPIIINATLDGLDLGKLLVFLRKYRNVIR